MTAASPEDLMRQIHHYAEQVATLHKFEAAKDAENAEKWQGFVRRREDEINAEVESLFAEATR